MEFSSIFSDNDRREGGRDGPGSGKGRWMRRKDEEKKKGGRMEREEGRIWALAQNAFIRVE